MKYLKRDLVIVNWHNNVFLKSVVDVTITHNATEYVIAETW